MSACKTISILASEIEAQLNELPSSHRKMISVMKKMPNYLTEGNLAKWEADYRNAISDDEDEKSTSYKAIDLVYEIAAINLFGEYQKIETKKIYHVVVQKLKKLGLTVSHDLVVDEW